MFRAKDLDKKDLIGSSDPFLVISRTNNINNTENDNNTTKKPTKGANSTSNKTRLERIYQTEVIKNTLNPEWKAFTLSLHELWPLYSTNINSNSNSPPSVMDILIDIDCYDSDGVGKDDLIGSCSSISLYKLFYIKNYFLIHPEKKQKSNTSNKNRYQHSGVLGTNETNLFLPSFNPTI